MVESQRIDYPVEQTLRPILRRSPQFQGLQYIL